MYVDRELTISLSLYRESILHDLLRDRTVTEIADDLSFYAEMDWFLAEQVVTLVEAGE